MIPDKNTFKINQIISLWSQGQDQFKPQGRGWQDLYKGPLEIATC